MPTLNKLEYLDETKKQIKSALNTNFNSQITDEDTFRSYVSKIDNIYTNWPKVTGEGTNITLSNTKKGKMAITPKGSTEQTTYSGKNYAIFKPPASTVSGLTITYDNITGKISVKGKSNTTSGIRISAKSDTLIPNGTYTLSINSPLSSLINYSVTDSQENNIAFRIPAGSTSVTNSLTNNGVLAQLFLSVENNVDYDLEFYLQLESGSTATEYEKFVGGIPSPNPDFPQDIRVVTGNNTINIHGKNLFDKDSAVIGALDGDGSIIDNGYYKTSDFIPVQPNTTYYKTTSNSARFKYYDKSKTPLSNVYNDINNANAPQSFTTPNNAYFIRLSMELAYVDTLQIEKGSTATTYQPYQSKDYEINLGSIELCKIGTYQDYLYKENNKWYKHSEIGKVVLDGTETGWGNYTNGTTRLLTFRKQLNEIKSYTQSVNIICDHFVRSSSNATNGQFANRYGNNQNLEFVYTNITSLDDFKIWLSTNNVKILFALTVPTITEITDDNLIDQLNALKNAMSFNDTTNISSEYEEGNAPFIISARALLKD